MGDLDCERTVTGWAARDPSGHLSPYDYTLRRFCLIISSAPCRKTGAEDVVVRVLYCGLCHTDLVLIRNELGKSNYPMVPGHEVVGTVSEIGEEVKKFKVGERVGVGCLVASCGACEACNENTEQYCHKRVWSYNDVSPDGKPTQGGFATTMVVHQRFVVHVPENLPLEQAAPLLCAGVTVYSPMKYFGMTEAGKRCGIVGLGGVGHMGVKIAKAFGLHVTVISSSDKKKTEAFEVLGADAYLVSNDAKQMQEAAGSLDYILDTVPVVHPLEPYLALLKTNGKLVMLGVVGAPLQFVSPLLILERRSIVGSFIGSIQETQETLELCAQKKVSSMIEVVRLDYVNEAIERLERNDVRYRFVVNVGATD